MRELRSDLPVKEIADNVYWLNEFEGTNCYLIVGEEKALLIDCGTGFCDLRKCVENITDKPVVLALTHGHVDHFGGAGQFKQAYINPVDLGKFNRFQMKKILRKIFVMQSNARPLGFGAKDVFDPEFNTEYLPMGEGHVFDLGGKIVKVHCTPGHSLGSVAFIDETDKIVFCGDNVCDMLWLYLPCSAPVEEWIVSAKWLYDMSETHRVFWGHRTPELSREYIGTVVKWGEEILAKSGKNARFSRITQYPKQEDGIIYRTGNVYKKNKG